MAKQEAFKKRGDRPIDTLEGRRERLSFGLGENEAGYEYIRENFFKSLYVLFHSLEDSEELKSRLRKYIVGEKADGTRLRDEYILSLKKISADGDVVLDPVEEDYFKSVELLSRTNPYAAALLAEVFGETDEFMENHLESLSESTWERIKDGDYIPSVQLGAGVNGIAHFGQVARIDPALASETLVVDAAPRVGGLFAVPHGPAWDMNSRTMLGPDKLPDLATDISVLPRAYTPGSWAPGQRNTGDPLRGGSINKPVGHLLDPDSYTNRDYITNEDMAVLSATLGATLFRNLSLETRVVAVEENKTRKRGLSIVTLERTLPDGRAEQKRVFTDEMVYAVGLGAPSYGFEIRKDGRAKDVLERQSPDEFPKLSTSLEALSAMADRRREPLRPPRTVVIGGSKDSARVMLEYLVRQFEEGSSIVGDVEKIYLISEGDITDKIRPRYLKLLNVLSRQGRKDIVELVSGRVADVGFANRATRDPANEELLFFNESGNLIRDAQGNQVVGDAYIACTGYTSAYPELQGYLGEDSIDDAVERVYLPNNPTVPIASRLKSAPHIRFVGVADPLGISQEERELLPDGTREVLDRIGENVVAIGVNAPRAAAAAGAALDERKFVPPRGYVPLAERGEKPPLTPVLGSRDLEEFPGLVVMLDPGLVRTERPAGHVRYAENLVSALVAYELRKFSFTDVPEGGIPLEISLLPGEVPAMSVRTDTPESFSSEFAATLDTIFRNKRIQVYVYALLRERKNARDKTLSLTLRLEGDAPPPGQDLRKAA